MAITKCINSESKQYKPVLTDKLVLDAVPTVNSLNGVTSDAVARAVAGASGEVPQVTENDNGKILTAIYDAGGPAVEWEEAPSGIPDMAGKDGKILGAVDNDGTMEAQWISKPVSNVTTSDKQFVVGVNGTGVPITVDCKNAKVTGSMQTVTDNGTFKRIDVENFAIFSAITDLGTGTATFTIPASIDASSLAVGLGNDMQASYINETTGEYIRGNLISGSVITGNVINSGTYTVSGANPDPSRYTSLAIQFGSGGSPTDLPILLDMLEEAMPTWTMTATVLTPTGYYTPAVPDGTGKSGWYLRLADNANTMEWASAPRELPTFTGNAGKVLTVNSGATGVEWATPSGGESSVAYIPLSPYGSQAAKQATFEAIGAAVQAGKAVVGVFTNDMGCKTYLYLFAYDNDGRITYKFGCVTNGTIYAWNVYNDSGTYGIDPYRGSISMSGYEPI